MLEDHLDEILVEIRNILLAKNAAYGDKNLVEDGLAGIIIRIKDKLNRLLSLQNQLGFQSVKLQEKTAESLEDTLLDIAGYAINALRLKREDLW